MKAREFSTKVPSHDNFFNEATLVEDFGRELGAKGIELVTDGDMQSDLSRVSLEYEEHRQYCCVCEPDIDRRRDFVRSVPIQVRGFNAEDEYASNGEGFEHALLFSPHTYYFDELGFTAEVFPLQRDRSSHDGIFIHGTRRDSNFGSHGLVLIDCSYATAAQKGRYFELTNAVDDCFAWACFLPCVYLCTCCFATSREDRPVPMKRKFKVIRQSKKQTCIPLVFNNGRKSELRVVGHWKQTSVCGTRSPRTSPSYYTPLGGQTMTR